MKKRGFTIVEISIVLLIVGLVILMAVKGHNLVQNAKVKRELKKVENIISAVNVYYDKHKQLPGGGSLMPYHSTDPVWKLNARENLVEADDFNIYNFKGERVARWHFGECHFKEKGAELGSPHHLSENPAEGLGYVCLVPSQDGAEADITPAAAPWYVVAGYELFYDDGNMFYGNSRGMNDYGNSAPVTSYTHKQLADNVHSAAIMPCSNSQDNCYFGIKVWGLSW